jgi:peptide/nickel transport system substrate-binding protein
MNCRLVAAIVLLPLTLAACARPPSPRAESETQAGAASAEPQGQGRKHIAIATFREMDFLPNNSFPGSPDVRTLVNPGLSVLDPGGTQQPLLTDVIPSVDNGLWKLLPDGRMEVTWRIKQGARWHDGEELTADDLVFTTQLGQDREAGAFSHTAFQSIEDAVALDPRTVVVRWKQPYIDADQMFTIAYGYLLPKHVLQPIYETDKANLTQIPFWTQSFVGTGPYRVQDYQPGTRIVLGAFDQYLPGRPRIDQVDLDYLPDPNTVLANLLSGVVDMTIGIGLPIDSALDLRDRWADGRVTFEYSDRRWYVLDPQFIDPTPAVLADLRFRRALLQGIDRQEMAEALQSGLAPIAHTFMSPNQPEYRAIEERVPKYDYDARRAGQMLEELGYQKGADGMLVGTNGQKLETIEMWASSSAVVKPMLSVAQYWGRLGIPTSTMEVPAQRASDWPWRAAFPGFQMFTGTHDVDGLPALYGARSRLPENNFQVAGIPNWPRYRSAALDATLDRYFTAIPREPRLQALSDINVHIAENLNLMGLYYFPTPYAMASRVDGLSTNRASKASVAWDAQGWNTK